MSKKTLYYIREKECKHSVRFEEVDGKGGKLDRQEQTLGHVYHDRTSLPTDCKGFSLTVNYGGVK